MSGLDEMTGLLEDGLRLEAPTGAARQRYNTERAAMLATVLDLQERARAAAEARRGRHLHRAHFADVRDVHALGADPIEQLGQAMLVPVADHEVDLLHGGDVARARLSPAPGHDQCRLRAHSRGAPDDLAIGELGAGGHGTRVDDDHVGGLVEIHGSVPARLEQGPDLLRVDLVEPAPEGCEGNGPGGAQVSCHSRWRPPEAPGADRTRRRCPRPCSTSRSS